MAIHYSGKTIGTFTLVQKRQDEEKPRKYNIQIRKSNCLMCAIHVYKFDNPDNPKLCWRHELVCVFMDEPHLKRCLKDEHFSSYFYGEVTNIKLNIYHKEMMTLLKYLVRDGLKVKCYYKEDKK